MNKKQQIKDDLIHNGFWDRTAKLACVSEGILSYYATDNIVMVELNIMAEDSFFSREVISELFTKHGTTFMEYNLYLIEEDGNHDKIASNKFMSITEYHLN